MSTEIVSVILSISATMCCSPVTENFFHQPLYYLPYNRSFYVTIQCNINQYETAKKIFLYIVDVDVMKAESWLFAVFANIC